MLYHVPVKPVISGDTLTSLAVPPPTVSPDSVTPFVPFFVSPNREI